MSRNRCSTMCACGFWSFDGESELPATTEGLLTEEQYFGKIGTRRSAAGYGYRDDLHGYRSYTYLRPGQDKRFTTWTNGPVPAESTVFVENWTEPVPETQRYRMRRLECPLCLSLYVGWYRAIPIDVSRTVATGEIKRKPLAYELYDTSYWHAFNDEPCPDGRDGPRRAITAEVVRAALESWFEAKGGAA